MTRGLRAIGRLAATLFAAFACALAVAAAAARAEAGPQLSALARIDPAASAISTSGGKTQVTLTLSQPTPFRAFLLDGPPRLVVDFREVDFTGMSPQRMLATAPGDSLARDLRWGAFRPGWSRMVIELSAPARIESSEEITTADPPRIVLTLAPASAADFAAATRAGAPASALWDLPQPAQTMPPHPRQDGSRPLKVVIDPGHGGIDPGAEVDGLQEKAINLTFARTLKDVMTRAGMRVVMTREEDVFVPLETRISVARAAGADLFLSLHADRVTQGDVTGASIFIFDPKDADAATQELTARHDRDDLLAGVDLEGHDDNVASVLMDLARAETRPRSVRLAQVLAGAIRGDGLRMHSHPVQKADFSVLKAPDIPSVLIELGFLSSPDDRVRLEDPAWRQRMAEAIAEGVSNWARADAAEARLLRR